MIPILQEYTKAFLLIFIAEMGDKTQILALAFATQYPVKKVLLGIFVGVLLNHGLAVAMGSLLATIIPLDIIQMIAGAAFIGFAFWTLTPVGHDSEETRKQKSYGPVLTVATAFFIGELGDKTQLTAITLATEAAYPLIILAGTLSGMMITGSIGIFIGKKLGDRIPEMTIKLVAAGIFLFFGMTKLFQTFPLSWITPIHVLIYTLALGLPVAWQIRRLHKQHKKGHESTFRRRARELHEAYVQINESVNQICVDQSSCTTCKGNECLIGYTKYLVAQGMAQHPDIDHVRPPKDEMLHNLFDIDKTYDTLALTLTLMLQHPGNMNNSNLHRIRRNLETILFNRYLQEFCTWTMYVNWLQSLHQTESDELANVVIRLLKEA